MDQSTARLKEMARSLPEKPGIYFFLGSQKQVLYIGKARSLSDRVKSYFLPTSDPKVLNILAEALDIDYILTDTEREASFLENNFIQQYQPKFNERLKDDKSYPYIKLTVQEPYPGIYFTRRVKPDGARYFGPFNPAYQARKTIHLVNRFFGIRDCRETIPSRRSRPCLQFDLGLCTAPCTKNISEAPYRERAENALLFLEGKVDELLKIIRSQMRFASQRLAFEQAAQWRDLIFTLEQIKEKPRLISTHSEDKDICGFFRSHGKGGLFFFFMRSSKVARSESIVRSMPEDQEDSAFLRDTLLAFYKNRTDIPATILLPGTPLDTESLKESLSQSRSGRIQLKIPVRGKNRKLVELANRNAALLLNKPQIPDNPLRELEQVLGLESPPRLIEGYDISNTGGDESVASRVVFRHGLPDKNKYRKYRIRSVAGPNDVASLQEVLHRRLSRLTGSEEEIPDLVLVDGGKGQFNAARTVLESLGLGNIPLVSLAKRQEILFSDRFRYGLSLDRTSPALRLLQNIRDEAHRFAITFHRQRRTKKSFDSLLDGIAGIGPQRKKRLLERYTSIESIRSAPLEDLEAVLGQKAAAELQKALGG
jgi:excinuclease ABC subunit C